MSTESPETILNQASETVERAPAAEYVPMADAYAEPEKKEKTFSGDVEGLKQAAAEVTERRAAQEPEPIERKYVTIDPDHPDYGKPRPAHETVSLERAADDLTRIRAEEQQAVEGLDNAVTAIQTDAERLGITPAELIERQQSQPEQIQPQPTTEIPGIDPEIAEALQRSPKLRETLQQEALRVQAVEQQAAHAHQAHAAAVAAAQQVALHFTLGNFPELAGLTQEQIPAALHVLEHSNPQRFQQVVSQLAKLDQVSKANAEVQARQQQRVQQQVAGWVQAQDAEVDSYLAKSEAPETVRSVKDNIPRAVSYTHLTLPTILRV